MDETRGKVIVSLLGLILLLPFLAGLLGPTADALPAGLGPSLLVLAPLLVLAVCCLSLSGFLHRRKVINRQIEAFHDISSLPAPERAKSVFGCLLLGAGVCSIGGASSILWAFDGAQKSWPLAAIPLTAGLLLQWIGLHMLGVQLLLRAATRKSNQSPCKPVK